jgi:hypothetical protein
MIKNNLVIKKFITLKCKNIKKIGLITLSLKIENNYFKFQILFEKYKV